MTFLHKLSNRLARLKALLVVSLAVLSCERPLRTTDASSNTVTRIAVTPRDVTLFPNQTTDVTAVGFTAAGDTAMGISVSWSVTGGTIIDTSTNSGRHYGRYKSGTQLGKYKVAATSSGTSDTAAVTVTQVPVATVAVTPATASAAVGQAVQLTATPRDSTGTPLSGRTVTWASSNLGVATVNVSGLVTGAAAGSAMITATSEAKSGTSVITVALVPVASVAVSPASASLSAGQAVQLTATPRDANGAPLSGRVVTWSSGNAAVAAVNGSGLVTAVATGSATITATSEGKSGTASVTVNGVPVASVTVSPGTASIMVGQTAQLTATPKDANGNVLTGRTVTWTSSNAGVATVNGTGLVTALAAGTAIITAACESATSTAAITVTNVPVASVTVSPPTASVIVGLTVQLTATPRDVNGTPLSGRVVTWGSSNTALATVNGSGVVTGATAGAATIAATSEGISGTATITVTAPPPPPPGGTWPNEPAGLTVRNDYGWSDNPNVNGNIGTSGWASLGGDASRLDDASAPLSPPSVMQIRFATGFTGGVSPITCWYVIPGAHVRELYMGFWIKVSNPWQGHPSGVNKIGFVTSGGTQNYALMPVLHGSAAPYYLDQQIAETNAPENPAYGGWLSQNVANPPFTLGVWHRVEMYLKYGTTSTSYNGIMKQWLDGTLVMSYSDINYADDGIDGWKIDPTWGGIGGSKTETDYIWIDHVHTSAR